MESTKEISKVEGLDDELKILKEKRQKLEEITEQLKTIKQKEKSQKTQIQETQELPKEEEQVETKSSETKYDQDKLALSKEEIIAFCDTILKKWSEDTTKNAKHIFAMNAVKTSVLWTDEETLKEIWSEILNWAFELLYKNAIAQGKDENLEWSRIMEKLSKR